MRFVCAFCLVAVLSLALPERARAVEARREESVAVLPQWSDFIRRQTLSLQTLHQCQTGMECPADITRWAGLIQTLQPQNKFRQLITVNKWFNRIQYKFDEDAYNTIDYWADTSELLDTKGDCEDYALSKYFTLRQLGFQPDQLKIIAVRDTLSYDNHAVLLVTMDKARFLLDINTDDMDPSALNTRYKPIYAFNENKAWFY